MMDATEILDLMRAAATHHATLARTSEVMALKLAEMGMRRASQAMTDYATCHRVMCRNSLEVVEAMSVAHLTEAAEA